MEQNFLHASLYLYVNKMQCLSVSLFVCYLICNSRTVKFYIFMRFSFPCRYILRCVRLKLVFPKLNGEHKRAASAVEKIENT